MQHQHHTVVEAALAVDAAPGVVQDRAAAVAVDPEAVVDQVLVVAAGLVLALVAETMTINMRLFPEMERSK